MDAFKGKYERTSAENYEEMLKVLDVNFLLRKAATASTPSNLLYRIKKYCQENFLPSVWDYRGGRSLDNQDIHNPEDNAVAIQGEY